MWQTKLSNLSVRIKEMHSIHSNDRRNCFTDRITCPQCKALKPHEPEEAGKGFVVIATEISKMAAQTGDATENITKLIENISTAIEEVVTVIYRND